MNIETKYGVGQATYFMDENMIEKGNITGISITVKKDGVDIQYRVTIVHEHVPLYRSFNEDDILVTRKQLFDHLASESDD